MTDLSEATADPAFERERVVTRDPPPPVNDSQPEPIPNVEGVAADIEAPAEEGAVGGVQQNPPCLEVYPPHEVRKVSCSGDRFCFVTGHDLSLRCRLPLILGIYGVICL